jgi:hypothetical protein
VLWFDTSNFKPPPDFVIESGIVKIPLKAVSDHAGLKLLVRTTAVWKQELNRAGSDAR